MHEFVLDELLLVDGKLERIAVCVCGASAYAAKPTERRPPLDGAGATV